MIAIPAVALTAEVQAQSPRHHHEPARQVLGSVAAEGAQALEAVPAQLFQHIGVGVHRGVVISMGVLGSAEQQVTIGGKEGVPGAVRIGLVRGAEEQDQLRREAHSLIWH